MFHDSHHHFLVSKLLSSQMSKLYAFQAMMTFVKSLLGIFVPVFLYSLGFSISDIVLYGMGISFMYLLAIPFSTWLSSKIGFKYTLFVSIPIYLFHIYSIQLISQSPDFFHLSWITFGLYMSLFWPAFHSEVVHNSSSNHRTSQIGTLQIISTLFATLAPFIGGFVLEFSGYFALLIFAIGMIALGCLPLFFSQDLPTKPYVIGYRDYVRILSLKQYFGSKLAFASEGVEWLLSLVLWPVVIYILLQENFFLLGLLFTFVSFLSVILVAYFKDKLDRHSKRKVLKITTRMMSFNWFLKSFVILFSSIFIYLIESISKLTMSIFSLTFTSLFYSNTKNAQRQMDYIILRELLLHPVKIIFGALLLGIFAIFGESMFVILSILVFGMVFALGIGFMKEE